MLAADMGHLHHGGYQTFLWVLVKPTLGPISIGKFTYRQVLMRCKIFGERTGLKVSELALATGIIYRIGE
jgi:hypothetical protein